VLGLHKEAQFNRLRRISSFFVVSFVFTNDNLFNAL